MKENMDDTSKPKRRSRAQIAKDEQEVIAISNILLNLNGPSIRWNAQLLRSMLDEIGDVLVEAGRL